MNQRLFQSLLSSFHSRVVRQGELFYRQGCVQNYRCVSLTDTKFLVNCDVEDAAYHSVELEVTSLLHRASFIGYCTCQTGTRFQNCRHMVAALYAFQNQGENLIHDSDLNARRLVDAFLNDIDVDGDDDAPRTEGDIRLVPMIVNWIGRESPLRLSFKIGAARLYIVHDIRRLLERFDRGEVFAYGKQFSFRHDAKALDASSRKWLTLIREVVDMLDASYSVTRGYEMQNQYPLQDTLPLPGRFVSTFFDLCQGKSIESRSGGKALVTEGAPKLSLKVEPLGNGARTPIWTREIGGEARITLPV